MKESTPINIKEATRIANFIVNNGKEYNSLLKLFTKTGMAISSFKKKMNEDDVEILLSLFGKANHDLMEIFKELFAPYKCVYPNREEDHK